MDINKFFEKNFYYESSRPNDVKDVISAARMLIKEKDLLLSYKASAQVVLAYKLIETGGSIDDDLYLGLLSSKKYFEKFLTDNQEPAGGIREDGKQVYISLVTVLWQVCFYIKRSPYPFLIELKASVENFELKKASYQQNLSRGLLVLAYSYYLLGNKEASLKTIKLMYEQYLNSVKALDAGFLIGSSHFGDLMKSHGCVQAALAGHEFIKKKRFNYKLWSDKGVAKLAFRVDCGVRGFSKFYQDLGRVGVDKQPETESQQIICVGIRYSLYQPGSASLHASSKSGSDEEYKRSLFSKDRMEAREKIFKSITLPSLEKLAGSNSDSNLKFLVVLAISKVMPEEYKKRIYKIASSRPFMAVVEKDEHEADVNCAMEDEISKIANGDGALIASVRLDDDDALSLNWFNSVVKELSHENVGKILTFPHGLAGFYHSEKQTFIGITEFYSENIALGLTSVVFFDGKAFSHKGIYGRGSHVGVDSVVVNYDGYAYLRVINSFRDKNYKSGGFSDRLAKDFASYLKLWPRVSVNLYDVFGAEVKVEESSVFFAKAEKNENSLVVAVDENSLPLSLGVYEVALYFYNSGKILKKIPYDQGDRFVFDDKELVSSCDKVKVFVRSVDGRFRTSKKISIEEAVS